MNARAAQKSLKLTLDEQQEELARTARAFVHALDGGESRCRNTVDSAVATLRLLDAVYRSSEEGRRVPLTGDVK